MMEKEHWFDYFPADSTIAGELNTLSEIYSELDAECNAWQQVSPYSCPTGCGICCTRFVPDVVPIEADYAASYLVLYQDEYQQRMNNLSLTSGCPFYNPDKAEHCTIYSVRPLICRLFAWSALSNKTGELEYKPCRHMEKNTQLPSTTASASPLAPPLMTIFSHRVTSIQPAYAGERILLPEQLAKSLQRINFLRQLYNKKND